MIRLYNVLREFLYLSSAEEPKVITPESETIETEADPNLGLNKALDTYRKLIEKNTDNPTEPLTDKQQSNLENRIKEIEEREVVEKIEDHDPVEIPCEKGKITITLVKQQIYFVIKMEDYHFVQDAVSRVSNVLKMDYFLSQGILVPDDYNANDLKSVTGSNILN